ncbi:MAG: hypothetical protein WKF30_04790 [Pyrinomonadaceae bacterium]
MKFKAYLRSLISSSYLNLRGTRRIALVLIVALCLPVVASAYTLVMRTGRRIVVPDRFVLSQDLLTYEASPGINVSVRVSHIDVSATEKINGEAPGGFLKRTSVKVNADAHVRGQQKTRTLTNGDLEAARQVRQTSERAYEQRRVELGLPPLEKSQLSAAEQEQSLRDALTEARINSKSKITGEREPARCERTFWRSTGKLIFADTHFRIKREFGAQSL